ncbi:xanthan lyase [Flammeovirga sp. MY04]|uniref:golvesin C-terminal-like domain-containing protein n=1 Tax=Flammeovirga sp. MY04 TaxID=1191459 RepID=UPI0008254149|nr:N-acetylmuramoyl-L-alanine amidase [Flammeovirga sp. MY04]ANQ48696.2 xanthan lyase [Flammeovirga sp. MY04]
MKRIFFCLLLLPIFSFAQTKSDAIRKFKVYLEKAKNKEFHYVPDSSAKLETAQIQPKSKRVNFFLGKQFEYTPVRNEDVEDLYHQVRDILGKAYQSYDLKFYVGKTLEKERVRLAKKQRWPITPKCEFKDLVPNYLRSEHNVDESRNIVIAENDSIKIPLVINLGIQPTKNGLSNKTIALWNSHGWYYEHSLDRWEWQRARLFQTVEDLLPTSFVLPYLAPMLENAGANVLLPRERDIQSESLVVDNDGDRKGYKEEGVVFAGGEGFLQKNIYNDNELPFQLGTSRKFKANHHDKEVITWSTQGKVKGDYSVYVSYATLENSVNDAKYTVYHQNQKKEFLVNQTMGGGTWVYLGTFEFNGHPSEKVTLSSKTHSKTPNLMVTSDAVRFGGGVGNIQRGTSTSHRPRFMEGARYHLQYSGAPVNVFTPNENKNDYKDDYQSRGEWVNWLTGSTYALNPDIENKGLNIPIDLAVALHTDAGISESDTTKGTLMIYSSTDMDKETKFSSNQSRYTNRDLADLIQTQIVEDLRVTHDSIWNRRELWDKRYSEAVYPNVPSVLIELLSHQNFKDMQYALDPKFRFDVSRSIYKGILKYIAYQNNYEYVVSPLKPTHFSIGLEKHKAILKWKPQFDPLEKSANPTHYKVYTQVENEGWDVGTIVKDTVFEVKVTKGKLYQFKVTAANDGGESFPTEELAMANFHNDPVLIVNAFDRIGGPTYVESENYTGFTSENDGVPDGIDVSFTGKQYDYNPNSEWLDDDTPGHGGSYADAETILVRGNTHDFTKIHGKALLYYQRSFVSCNRKAVEDGIVNLNDYQIVDIMLGEQKSTLRSFDNKLEYQCFTPKFKESIHEFTKKPQSKLLISGAFVGSDLVFSQDGKHKGRKHKDVIFAHSALHFKSRGSHADRTGNLYNIHPSFNSFKDLTYAKNIDTHLYAVEAVDALDPYDSNTEVIGRYLGSNKSAGIAFKNEQNKVIVIGFPFETINLEIKRIELMGEILQFFEK